VENRKATAYSGGCKEHKFSLQIAGCMESFPVQCPTVLVDSETNDFCEAFIQETVLIQLKDAGLTDSYYRGALLTIKGSDNKSVNVTLPR
jgi:hypothetical protein